MSITINAESGATVNVYESGSDHGPEVDSTDSEQIKGSKEPEVCSGCYENENKGSSDDVIFNSFDLTDLAGLEVKEYPKGEGIDFIQEELNLDDDQMAGLLQVFDTDGDGGLSKDEVEVMKTVLAAIFEAGVPEDGVSLEVLQQYMDELGGEVDPQELNITSSRTLTGLMGLNESKSYTIEDLMKAVPSLTEEDAEALVAQFDQDGDGKLNSTETAVMKDAVTAAVFDGGFNDKKLTSDDLSGYLSQDATIELIGLEELAEDAYYTKETLREAAPSLTQKNAEDLIALFDADGSGYLDAAEVGAMKEILARALDDGHTDNSYELLSIDDLKTYMDIAPQTSRSAFDAIDGNMDGNKDGTVTKDEMKAYYTDKFDGDKTKAQKAVDAVFGSINSGKPNGEHLTALTFEQFEAGGGLTLLNMMQGAVENPDRDLYAKQSNGEIAKWDASTASWKDVKSESWKDYRAINQNDAANTVDLGKESVAVTIGDASTLEAPKVVAPLDVRPPMVGDYFIKVGDSYLGVKKQGEGKDAYYDVREYNSEGKLVSSYTGDPHVDEDGDGKRDWHFANNSSFTLSNGAAVSFDTKAWNGNENTRVIDKLTVSTGGGTVSYSSQDPAPGIVIEDNPIPHRG